MQRSGMTVSGHAALFTAQAMVFLILTVSITRTTGGQRHAAVTTMVKRCAGKVTETLATCDHHAKQGVVAGCRDKGEVGPMIHA